MYNFFKNQFIKFLKIKYEFKIPKKNTILFLRKHNLDLFKKYIYDDDISVIDYPDSINFIILVKSLFSKKADNLYVNYLINYIQECDPKIIITFIDNHYPYYLLKKYFKNKKIIAIQNGYRGGDGDFFDKNIVQKYFKMNMKADYILTFNESTGKEFKEIVDCKNIVVGSFRNNIFPITKNTYKNSLAFISSYTPDRDAQPTNFFFDIEIIIVRFLIKYCNKKNLDFYILPRIKSDGVENFFLNLGLHKTQILKKEERYSTYKNLDKFSFLVGTETTMTYEALARSQKIAVISSRGNFFKKNLNDPNINFDQYKFLWPGNVNLEGRFWTSKYDEISMERVVNFVTNCTDEEWQIEINKISNNDKILYDFGNTKLKKLIIESI